MKLSPNSANEMRATTQIGLLVPISPVVRAERRRNRSPFAAAPVGREIRRGLGCRFRGTAAVMNERPGNADLFRSTARFGLVMLDSRVLRQESSTSGPRFALLPWGGKLGSATRCCAWPASADRHDPVVRLALRRPDHDLVPRPVTEQRATHR